MNIHLHHNVQPEFDPEKYIVDEGLQHAFEVAFALRQPLLLMGEPGTGKTMFAKKMAWELAKKEAGFRDKPLVFNTKTGSSARDLFYAFDSLAHFQDANMRQESRDGMRGTHQYIKLEALGLAIAQTDPAQLGKYPSLAGNLDTGKRSSVVLIDEIDKAPRRFSQRYPQRN
jgi:MoxR-like ATPase